MVSVGMQRSQRPFMLDAHKPILETRYLEYLILGTFGAEKGQQT